MQTVDINNVALCSEVAPGDLSVPFSKKDPSIPSIHSAIGIEDLHAQALLWCHCMAACGYTNVKDIKEREIAQKTVQNTVVALSPTDAMEGRLIAQLVTLQERGMQFLEYSHSATSIEQQNLYVNMSSKMFRTANETVDMLLRWRRKGSQTVVVQHVNVEGGGKAIVGGNMIAGGGHV